MAGKSDLTSPDAVRSRIRQAFERWGGSQAELAARVGAAKGTVSDWFNVKKPGVIPDGERMARLPGALGVSGHWLLTGEGPTVASGDGALKRAERAAAGTVLSELQRILEQLRMVHASDTGADLATSQRVAQVLEHERAQSRGAVSMPSRRKTPRRRAS